MMAKTHQVFGLTCGLATFLGPQHVRVDAAHISEAAAFFAAVWLGSLLPDLDTTKSKLGRRFLPLSVPMSMLFGHRRFTHSFLFIALVAIIGYFFNQSHTVWLGWGFFGLTLGTASHILGDLLTVRGVPLIFPASEKPIRLPVAFRTGSSVEAVVLIALVVLDAYWIYSWWG